MTNTEKLTLDLLVYKLRKILLNSELLDKILIDLDNIVDPRTTILSASNEKIEFVNSLNGFYSLIITPNSIEEVHNNRLENISEKLNVSFNGKYTSVRRDSIIGNQVKDNSVVSRHTIITDYMDNEVIHERDTFFTVNTDINNSDSFTTDQETFVRSNRIAYSRETVIDNNGKFKTTYSKCCAYNPKPFNDMENERAEEKPFFYSSNENEFVTSAKRF